VSVVELRSVRVSVIEILASASACDGLAEAGIGGANLARVAPDELLVIGDEGGPALAADVFAKAVDDPHALVLDVTDGWSTWAIEGAGVAEVIARLSELRLPERGFVQGAVANMPAKVLVDLNRITVLVPSMLGAAFRERVVHDGRHLGVREAT
jgi:sarcosine oxidase gamma subunit